MKKAHFPKPSLRILAGLTALFGANASAVDHEVTVTNSSVDDPPGFTVSNADLLQTAFDSYNGSALDDAPGGTDTTYLQGLTPSGEESLRDGVWFSNPSSRGSAMVQDDEFAEFSFDLVSSPGGYTINGVDLYSNWGTGNGRNEIRVNVSFSLVGDPTNFDQVLVASTDPLFVYNPTAGQTQGKMSLTGFSVAGVAAIRFDWPASQENAGVGYSELDVFGVAATDTDPPALSNSIPTNGATDVSTVADLVLTFNEDITAGTGIIDLRTVTPDASVETFDVTLLPVGAFDGRDLTLDPSSPLTPGEEYYLAIPIGAIEDLAGNDFAGFLAPPDASAFTFTTDNTPPALTGTELLLNLLPTADLMIEFDEAVVLGTGTITIHLASDNSVVESINIPADASVDGTAVVADIADLAFGTDYYLNVSAGAITDTSGNAFPAVSDNSALTVSTVSDAPSILIHYWPFDGDATDSVGTHDGVLSGGIGFEEGLFADALNPRSGGCDMSTSSLPATNFTGACWINPSLLSGSRHIFGSRVGGSAGAMLRLLSGGVPTVSLQSATNVVLAAPNPVNVDEWTHLAYTVDSTNGLTLYVNGSSVANDPLGTTYESFANFSVGRRPDVLGENFNGLIDEVRIYAEVLSPAQIAALAVPPSSNGDITLMIAQSGGNLDFSWNSQSGKQYDLLSAPDFSTPISSWLVYDDGVNPLYEDIPSAGALTTLTGVVKVGPARFFAIVEEEIPLPLSEDFEAGASIPAGWVAADNGNGTAWEAGPPTNGFPAAAANGSNCAGTNLGGNHTSDADATLTSPSFAAPAGGATLSFQRYIDTEGNVGDNGPDFGTVRILDADNADTEIVDGVFPVTQIEGFELGWDEVSFPLPAAALGKNIKIQFQFVSNGSTEFSGFYIDDVTVTP